MSRRPFRRDLLVTGPGPEAGDSIPMYGLVQAPEKSGMDARFCVALPAVPTAGRRSCAQASDIAIAKAKAKDKKRSRCLCIVTPPFKLARVPRRQLREIGWTGQPHDRTSEPSPVNGKISHRKVPRRIIQTDEKP